MGLDRRAWGLCLTTVAITVAVVSLPKLSGAQVNCEALAAGTNRTDCYIGLARIHRQRSIVAAGAAEKSSDAAALGRLTGASHLNKARHFKRRVPIQRRVPTR
jgi:hypothetical protein